MSARCEPSQVIVSKVTRTINSPKSSLCALIAAAAMLAVLLMSAPLTVFAARAENAFIKELKAQNAHHFANQLTSRKSAKPPTIERRWEKKFTRKRWTMTKGPVTIEVTLKKGGPPDALIYVRPLLSVSVAGQQVISIEGSESYPDNPIFLVQIAEMDKGNPYPEVVFSVYSGGAHCCSDTHVLASSKDGKTWQDIEAGIFDGGPLGVSDLDGDGRFEFSLRDNAFLYTFGCYACSTAPFKVLRLEDGKLVDISTDPAFRDHHLESLQRILEWAAPDMDANGFLAGYVAQKILLGEGAQAWKFMVKQYDRKNDWGLEECSLKVNGKGECPGRKVKLSYPDALKRFLNMNGYKL